MGTEPRSRGATVIGISQQEVTNDQLRYIVFRTPEGMSLHNLSTPQMGRLVDKTQFCS